MIYQYRFRGRLTGSLGVITWQVEHLPTAKPELRLYDGPTLSGRTYEHIALQTMQVTPVLCTIKDCGERAVKQSKRGFVCKDHS